MTKEKKPIPPFDELVREAYQLHFEISQICNTLLKQKDSPAGYLMITLKDLRLLTNKARKLDQTIRIVSMEKSNELHAINSRKWKDKREV